MKVVLGCPSILKAEKEGKGKRFWFKVCFWVYDAGPCSWWIGEIKKKVEHSEEKISWILEQASFF